jgi:twitching motility protein PilJ
MSSNAYGFRHKTPQSKFLLGVFFLTLILVVVNQVFLNMQAWQDEVRANFLDFGYGVTLPFHPLISYALLLTLVLTIVGYGQQVIRRAREAEQFTAEKNKRNSEAVMKLINEISSLADGDLTVEATVDAELTGPIADSINNAVGQMRGLVSAMTDVSTQVATSTDASTQRVEVLSEAARRQSESIDSVYVSIREIGKDISLVSDNAYKSLKVAENSVTTAAGGAEVVKNTIKGMDGIRDQIQDTSRRIKRLGESSQAIGNFVSLIGDIAAHTNTLSLNAAIQAAAAGDAGKGFAVVADEVHALAERSRDATRQIESLVKIIQGDIKEVVQSMEQTTAEVVSGTSLARKAGGALDDIERVSKQLAELVSSISDASRNQSKAATELKGSMEVIRQVTLKTSGGIEETRAFILKLGGLTEQLRQTVSGFSLSKRDKWARMNKKDNVMSLEPKKTTFVNHHHDNITSNIVNA